MRAPLVDATLLAAIARIAGAARPPLGKAALAAAPRRPPPAAVLSRAKTGFSTPVAVWRESGARDAARTAPGRAWARALAATASS